MDDGLQLVRHSGGPEELGGGAGEEGEGGDDGPRPAVPAGDEEGEDEDEDIAQDRSEARGKERAGGGSITWAQLKCSRDGERPRTGQYSPHKVLRNIAGAPRPTFSSHGDDTQALEELNTQLLMSKEEARKYKEELRLIGAGCNSFKIFLPTLLWAFQNRYIQQ